MRQVVLVMGLVLAAAACDSRDSSEAATAAKVMFGTAALPGQPIREMKPGSTYWAVYVYAGQAGLEAEAAMRRLVAAGYDFAQIETHDVGCDEGAVEALRVRPENVAVSLYFADEADARLLAMQMAAPLANVVRIKYLCR